MSQPLTSLCSPEEFELDLSDFTLSERTSIFFENLSGLLQCKLDADGKYEQVGTGVLKDPKYDIFGESPTQDGPKIMTVKQVRADAEAKKPLFEEFLESIVKEMGMIPDEVVKVDEEPIKTDFGSYTVLTLAPLKSEERSRAKTQDDYNGNAKFLCDVGRATIVCKTEDQIAQVIEELRKKGDVVRTKNRFAHPFYTGVRDVLMNIKVEGHVFEVQVHLADMLAISKRSHGHHFYEYFREYFVGKTESYAMRTELFRQLGDAIQNSSSITEGIRTILNGKDKVKLQALEKITSSEIFADHELNLQTQKRLMSLLLQEGEEEKAVLYKLNNMAVVYDNQGNYEKALEMYQRALEGYEAALGKEHPDTLGTVNNMAALYSKQGNYEKALEMYQRALEGYEAALGKEHPDTLMTVNNMAVVYWNQGNYEKALEMYQRALEGRETALGKYHESTCDTAYDIADLYQSQSHTTKAVYFFEWARKGYEKSLGKNHSKTVDAANRISSLSH